MSSASGVGVPTFHTPTFEAPGVVQRIESQVGSVKDLFAEVQTLLNEINGLKAEAPVKGKDESDEAFAKRVQDFQDKLNKLNHRLESVYRKLGQAQAILQKLQGQELPAAEGRDRDRMQKAMDDMQKALEAASKTLGEAKEEAGVNDGREEEARIELRTIVRKLEIRISEDPTFKDVIQAFAIAAQVVGDPSAIARRSNPMTNMPPAAGSGLPPVDVA